MKPEYEQFKNDLLFEQSQLEIVVSKIKEIKDIPSEINTAALATYLMNFYNGIENIMKRCAKEYYKKMPKGDGWHKELLQQSFTHNKSKIPLFDKNIVDKLYNYLLFRHFFIHGYGFKLNRDKLKSLVDDIDKLWIEIKNCVAEFIARV